MPYLSWNYGIYQLNRLWMGKTMEICHEMQKLREFLEAENIKWEDDSEESSDGEWWMCRTKIPFDGGVISINNGKGSYGGFVSKPEKNQGLLEIWCEELDFGPVGWQTAKDLKPIIREIIER
jgi:hypothetical protein